MDTQDNVVVDAEPRSGASSYVLASHGSRPERADTLELNFGI